MIRDLKRKSENQNPMIDRDYNPSGADSNPCGRAAGMARAAAAFLLMVWTAACLACAGAGRTGVNTPQIRSRAYPVEIDASGGDRRKGAEAEWRRLCADYSLEQLPPVLDPLLATPVALPEQFAAKIQLGPPATGDIELDLKEALREFIRKHGQLLFNDPGLSTTALNDLALVSFSRDSGRGRRNGSALYHAVYSQTGYDHPVENGFGVLKLSVNVRGELVHLSSRLLPRFDLPAEPALSSSIVLDRIAGKELNFELPDGRNVRLAAPARNELSVAGLAVYPLPNGPRIRIHLAYRVEAGKSPAYSLFYDAMTGDYLGARL